ncbi:MAG: hypothetical protein GXO04_04700 [Aquificae bacterium]|nr:hypothetical protein [Aquificota bacterium]
MALKEISKETVEKLLKIMEGTIGESGVKTVLRRLDPDAGGRELVYAFADELMKLYGEKGAFALIRQLGRELAKSFMRSYPQERWEEVLKGALGEFGFARSVELFPERAGICGCVFYELIAMRGLGPTQHAVCWCGWGFIEGFVREMTGAKGIEWKERDYDREVCYFEFIT